VILRRSDCWVSARIVERRFDQRGPALAGTQLIGEVGAHCVAMLVQIDDDGIRIVGLVTSANVPAADLDVELFDGSSGAVRQTVRTNAFGEFDLIGPLDERWAIRVGDDPYTPRIRLWEALR